MPVSLELSLVARVLVAAFAGALIGLEREIHAHPAGMRTHLMVAIGACTFTILSMYGFSDVLGQSDVVLDPSRVAAQIVSGIGFIGGGAILKYGASIRGLTTAGSLWATASIGFAFGSGLVILGTAVTLLIVFSLWPLNWIIEQVRTRRAGQERIRLSLTRLEALSDVYAKLRVARVEVLGIESERIGKGHYEVGLELRAPVGTSLSTVVMDLGTTPDIQVLDTSSESY
jgi:putative Mg2+ transporter-C (MgtC) family protein